jgi:hypothetical protein
VNTVSKAGGAMKYALLIYSVSTLEEEDEQVTNE